MPDLDAAFEGKGALSIGGGVAFVHLGGFDVTVRLKITTYNEPNNMALGGVGTRDPGGATNDTGIGEHTHAFGCQTTRTHIAFHQERVSGKISFGGEFNHGRFE